MGKRSGSGVSGEGVVDALVDSGFDPAVAGCDVDDVLDLLSGVVADAEAGELALFVGLVHGLQRVLERDLAVRRVEVEQIHLLRAQRSQAVRERARDVRRLKRVLRRRRETGVARTGIHFGGDREAVRGGRHSVAKLLEVRLGTASAVHARRVQLGVPVRREDRQDRSAV